MITYDKAHWNRKLIIYLKGVLHSGRESNYAWK